MSDELEVIPVNFDDLSEHELVMTMWNEGKLIGVTYRLRDEKNGAEADAILVGADRRQAVMFFQVMRIAHRANEDTTDTACGEPWQGWQAPEELDQHSVVLPPHAQPTHGESVRQCQACAKVAAEKAAEEADDE